MRGRYANVTSSLNFGCSRSCRRDASIKLRDFCSTLQVRGEEIPKRISITLIHLATLKADGKNWFRFKRPVRQLLEMNRTKTRKRDRQKGRWFFVLIARRRARQRASMFSLTANVVKSRPNLRLPKSTKRALPLRVASNLTVDTYKNLFSVKFQMHHRT